MADIPLYVITGGPCSGKTKTSRWLREMHDHVFVIPEAATMIMREHEIFGAEFDHHSVQQKFQHLLAHQQKLSEVLSIERAQRLQKQCVVADRGILDGIAYLPGGRQEYEKVTGLNLDEEMVRYRTIFWFDLPPRDIYEQKVMNNPVRYEDYKTALARSIRTREVWQNHPHVVEISGTSFQNKFDNFLTALQDDLKEYSS